PKSSRRTLNQFHKLRRSVATITAVNRGLAAASELLGHSSIEVTRRYVDPSRLPGSDFTEVLPVLTAAPDRPVASAAEHADTWGPLEYLSEARTLAAAGHLAAAAVTARIAFERGLAAWSRRRNGQPADNRSRIEQL